MSEHDDDKADLEQRIGRLRDGAIDADATGMVANEEAVAQIETLLPLLRERPALPSDQLHGALPADHAAHATIDLLHAEIERPKPDRSSIETHVQHLRAFPELEATVANWWDAPATQRFVWTITQIGL